MFNEIEVLRREMDRLFESYMGAPRSRRWRTAFLPGRATRSYPLVNLQDEKEAIRIEALAPGIKRDTLEVTIQGDQLTLAGEKVPPEGIRPEQYHRSERSAGKFVRQLTLPCAVDDSKVEAKYEDGLLKLYLPKAEEAKPRQITIQAKS